MASIQILELRPVEGQIKELSYDTIGSIWGGQATFTSPLGCVAEFLSDLAAEIQNEIYNPAAIIAITGKFIECLDDLA